MDNEINTHLKLLKDELKIFVKGRVKDQSLADDIVQDVLVKVFIKIDQLKNSEKILSWVYQIARNTINDHYRKHKKVIDPERIDWESDTNTLNECVALCLKKLVMTLPEKYQEAFRLSELEDLSQAQLAKHLGISYSGAKSRVQRARLLLKKKAEEILIIKTDAYGNVLLCEDRKPCCRC